MVGHNDSDMQRVSASVVVQAAAEGDVPCPVWQLLSEFSNECDEVRFVVTLKMRQVTAIEGYGGNYSAIKDRDAIGKARRNMRAPSQTGTRSGGRIRPPAGETRDDWKSVGWRRNPDECVRGYVDLWRSLLNRH